MPATSRGNYTAVITGNRRDTNLMTPKVLLIDVRYSDGTLFRDHTWVLEEYFKVIPKGHHKRKTLISFTAKEQDYISLTGDKVKLVSLKDIKYIKRT